MTTTKTIKVNYLARVEGEGALHVKIKDRNVQDVMLKIFEPPRFFEAFLRGRAYHEAPDITSRICGICPVAYQMSAVKAIEDALGVTVPEPLQRLRRLLYCGEWIESHVLHIYMLHAPDFLGYPDAMTMAKDFPQVVERGLALKKAGNKIVQCLGGREIHPISVRIGGFYAVPTASEMRALREILVAAMETARATIEWVAKFHFPEVADRKVDYVALRHDREYPIDAGVIVSSFGLQIPAKDYEDHFEEIHVAHTNALHSVVKGRGAYLTGPLARYNLNSARLSPAARQAAGQAGLGAECHNPFKSIIVRAVEVLYAVEEAIAIIDEYVEPKMAAVPVQARAGVGFGCTEAPRGLLYHRYELNDAGDIMLAKIVPPTSQNQKAIEDDLRALVPKYIDLPKKELTHLCEQAIRNHDPCISCATHFLRLDMVDETGDPR